MPLHGTQLLERTEEISLYIFSTLEFQNTEAKALLFQDNLDERIMACLKEICKEGSASRRDTNMRLFVWETSPEIKKKNSMTELYLLIFIVIALIISAFMRTYFRNVKGTLL